MAKRVLIQVNKPGPTFKIEVNVNTSGQRDTKEMQDHFQPKR